YKIFIGDKDENGDYYVRSDGSNAVYTLSSDTVDTMLQVEVFSIMNPYVCLPNIDSVDKISAEIAGKQYTMQIKHPTATNDADKDETSATYYYNGNEVTEDNFKSVYQSMIAAKYDAELTQDVDTSALEPVMTLSYHIFGDTDKTFTTSYLSYNDSFYIADIGKSVYFLVDKRVIDQITNAISTFTVIE
ncbi:MAG: DUF4340 domain-containing protein, partial [Herbinix sp.]|nr:DUF4340 domain-containing protein [Herbinix sp.]